MQTLRKVTTQLQLENQVHFLKHIADTKKAEVLGKSWVMLQPSMVEGWGITVTEANACGTPVIAAKVNGLKDSVQHRKTGLLVEPNHILKLAQAMDLMVSDNQLRERLSGKAYQWSHSFNWDHSARLFYARLLEESDQASKAKLRKQFAFAASTDYEQE